jgi:cytochrome oxidase Cu insertion factor (SCO1/SenC/PrrC family)
MACREDETIPIREEQPNESVNAGDTDGRTGVGGPDHAPAGKAVILNFVYARCQDVCPLHMVGIAELQQMMNTARMQELIPVIGTLG